MMGFEDLPIIHAHTRADLFRDGDLVDISATAREAGFPMPAAVTRKVWDDCVGWTSADAERTGALQDEQGRLWDVVWMALIGARRNPDTSSFEYEVLRIDRNAKRTPHEEPQATLVQLAATLGSGDFGEVVLTIHHPGDFED